MNYDDYYAQQVGGALPYFAGERVQRGHGFGSLFGGLLRSVAPLIKRGALALGNRALKTGAQIAGDVLSGENIRTAAKRRTKTAGRDLLQSLLATPSPPGKRVKRAAPQRGSKQRRPVKRAARRRRIAEAVRSSAIVRGSEERTGPVRRTADADEHRTRWLDRTPTDHVARFGWPDRIRRTRSRRRLHRSFLTRFNKIAIQGTPQMAVD